LRRERPRQCITCTPAAAQHLHRRDRRSGDSTMNESIEADNHTDHQLRTAFGSPEHDEIEECRERCDEWFAATAPLISWDAIETPLGMLYIAATEEGVSNIELGMSEADFVARLDPLARTVHDPQAIAP